MGGHFATRLQDQRWIIAGTSRGCALIGNGASWLLSGDFHIDNAAQQHPQEEQIAALWCCFYRHINNPQRYNPQLRQQIHAENVLAIPDGEGAGPELISPRCQKGEN